MTVMTADLTIGDLPWLVSTLLEKGGHPVAGTRIRPRYLREKPGRGLVLTFQLAEQWGTLKLDRGLRQRRLPFDRSEALAAVVRADGDGVISADALDVRIQLFPSDPDMPALSRCMDPARDDEVLAALEEAGRVQLGEPALTLVSAEAEAVRYKPGSRCTIRYRLTLVGPASIETLSTLVYGKVYSDLEDAELVQRTLASLHAATSGGGARAVLPAPLAWSSALGLVLFEALEQDPGRHPLLPGASRSDTSDGLGKAAQALARLHAVASKAPSDGNLALREANRVQQRAELLAASCPEHAARLMRLSERIARRLELMPPALRPVHGAMKPSHVLYSKGAAVLIDCDSSRMDDPAMDLGGFLAYLRPGGTWFGRRSAITWYEEARRRLVESYRRSVLALGVGEEEIDSCIERSRAYECSRLLKIAARRPQRLNCIQPAELGAVCDAIERILGEDNR